jgi:pullulanase/glycogen debranching enzyme
MIFNHESQATRYLVDRVIEHWLLNYKVDGFRWDLSKGFTQTNNPTNVDQWSKYDLSRINIWKRIYGKMQTVAPGSYCILEHFAENSEEIELSNAGMMLWGNGNYNYNEATMGWVTTSEFLQ